VIAGNGGTQRILSQLPYAIGMEMLLTGDTIDAETAARWGLVNRVVPLENLMDEAMAFARKIAANAPLAVQAAKELAIRAREMPLTAGLRLEQLTNRMLQFTEDAKEGPAAFAEKRKPNFRGA
jgi:E-phenylitaconyl-CoA hydratase